MVLCSVAKAAKINYSRQLKPWPSLESNRQKQRGLKKEKNAMASHFRNTTSLFQFFLGATTGNWSDRVLKEELKLNLE